MEEGKKKKLECNATKNNFMRISIFFKIRNLRKMMDNLS